MEDSDRQRVEEIAANLTALLARAGPLEAADDALALAREGLSLVTRESAPVLWARLHMRIGAVGTVAGYDRGDLGMLREAVASNAAALAVCTREADAATWFNWWPGRGYNPVVWFGVAYAAYIAGLELARFETRIGSRVVELDSRERWASMVPFRKGSASAAAEERAQAGAPTPVTEPDDNPAAQDPH